jgi:hypothetical protein
MVRTKELDEKIRAVFARGSRYLQSASAIEALAENPLGNFLKNEWIRACSSAPALSPEDYAARLIDLANLGRLPATQFFELAGGSRLQLEPADTYGRISETLLAPLRERLAIIVSRKQPAMAKLNQELWTDIQAKVVAIPTSEPEGFRYVALDTPAALAFVTRMLLTSELVAPRLCRCSYRSCSQFFLIDPVEVKKKRGSPRGRIRRDYCTPAHRIEEQRLRNSERQQKIRDKRKAARAAKPRKKK